MLARKSKVRALIVDDSALVRQVLRDILETDPEIEVIGAAADPFAAAELMRRDVPDVLTLDIEMPRMDGLTFLKKIMRQHPIPTVICSSLAEEGSATVLAALEAGAVDVILKPQVGQRQFFEESRIRICDVVKAAAHARIGARKPPPAFTAEPKLSADAVLRPPRPGANAMIRTTEKVVVVGASTGGTDALREFLEAMPLDCPQIAIVQHMPERFTQTFAQRLNQLCRIAVLEATSGAPLLTGQAIIARGNMHMVVRRSGARYHVDVIDGALVSRHRPSVDVLFRSTAESAGRNAVGVIMTGMGDDGARGMKEMKDAGAHTLAQDEQSCVVFGMPAEAIKAGCVDDILPLSGLAPAVLRATRHSK